MGLLQHNQKSKTDFAAINDALVLDVETAESVRFEFSGVYTFTTVFEATVDGTNWFPFLATLTNTGGTSLNHATANATQAYEANCRAVAKVRARVSAFTSAGAHKVLISAN